MSIRLPRWIVWAWRLGAPIGDHERTGTRS